MLKTEEKKRAINIDEPFDTSVSHIINDTISEKGAQTMMKSIGALDEDQTPRSTKARFCTNKRFSMPDGNT